MICWARLTMAVALTSSLGGCADKPPVVIENKSVPAAIETPEVRQATAPERAAAADVGQMLQRGPNYIVQPGDTLYAVAFRLGMDYRTLAEINDIDPPYVIRVSQSLKTIDAGSGALGDATSVAPAQSVAVEPDRLESPPRQTSPASAGQKAEPVRLEPGPPSHTLSTAKLAMPNGPVDRWVWPAAGEVSRPFSDERHKGIDLAGQRGAPVMATAPGVVVYAGTGVTGYGALLILKHNDTYLSAYGHNDELLAVEGEQVKAGQVIARMGSTDADSVKLHFEIRRDGRPVNPTGLLPSR
jgi:lipoprotein NlpD